MISLSTRHCWLALFVLCPALPAPTAHAQAEPPNILWIVADDLGHADVGFNGLEDFTTPHIDALAAAGTICREGYASHPFCAPTRAGLMAGRYQQRFGFYNNPKPPRHRDHDPDFGLPPEESTIAETLSEQGYRTAAIGKWHLGEAAKFHPLEHGFGDFFGFLAGWSDYYDTDLVWQRHRRDGRAEDPPAESSRQDYLTDLFTDEAVRFIREADGDRPWFLYLAYNAPHTPLQAPQRWLDRIEGIDDPRRHIYAAMVTAMDDGIGRVRAALEEAGSAKDTLVFFLSDNGGVGPVNGARNDPFRGLKGSLFEGGIRVPFVAAWPGVITAGAEYPRPVISLDLHATSLAAAGAPVPEEGDAVDLVPFLKGEEAGRPPHRALFWRTGRSFQAAARMGDTKRLHVDGTDDRFFDLGKDPEEGEGAARDPALAEHRALDEAYEAWEAELRPDRPSDASGFKIPQQYREVGLDPPEEAMDWQRRHDRREVTLEKALPK